MSRWSLLPHTGSSRSQDVDIVSSHRCLAQLRRITLDTHCPSWIGLTWKCVLVWLKHGIMAFMVCVHALYMTFLEMLPHLYICSLISGLHDDGLSAFPFACLFLKLERENVPFCVYHTKGNKCCRLLKETQVHNGHFLLCVEVFMEHFHALQT